MMLSRERSFSLQREAFVGAVVFLMTALFFISLSVFATTVGTNIDATGTVGAATSTPWGDLAVDQVAGKGALRPVFAVGDNGTTTPFIFVSQKGVVSFGSSTPSNLFLTAGDVVIGRNGATSDLYVSGGLGVGNATTTDNGFVVGADLFTVYANGNIGMFGTSSPVVIDGLSLGGGAGTHADLYVSGGLGVGNATTTDNGFVIGAGLFTVYANGNIGMIGTSSPALTDGVSIGTDTAGTNADVYVSGGLGVGDATTTDDNIQVKGRTITTKLVVGTGNGNVASRIVHGTCTVNPPSLHAGGTGHAACTDATGVTSSDRVLVGVEGAAWLDDVDVTAASSTANDTINFVFKNTSTTTVRDVASGVHIYYFGTQ